MLAYSNGHAAIRDFTRQHGGGDVFLDGKKANAHIIRARTLWRREKVNPLFGKRKMIYNKI